MIHKFQDNEKRVNRRCYAINARDDSYGLKSRLYRQ